MVLGFSTTRWHRVLVEPVARGLVRELFDMSASSDRDVQCHTEGRPAIGCGPQLGEDSLRRVVEWAPSAMVMIDHHGVMVLVNAQTERMFGQPREQMIWQSIEVLVPERYRHHHQQFRAGFYADPQPRPMGVGRDLTGRRADGSEFPIQIGFNPIETESGVIVLASVVDISERRRTQRRLEDAVQEKTVLLNASCRRPSWRRKSMAGVTRSKAMRLRYLCTTCAASCHLRSFAPCAVLAT